MTTSRRSLALLVLVVLSLTGSAAAGTEKFTGTTEVVAVEVPVYVLAGGQPVRGLRAEDFAVYDRRKQQKITGFSVIDLGSRAPASAAGGFEPLPIAARRHFLLLFDLSFSRPSSIVKARSAAHDLVREKLHPSDLVAVGSYTVANGPRLIVGFTPDRTQVARAIDTLGLPQMVRPVGDPLGFMLETIARMVEGGRPESDYAEFLRELALVNERGQRQVDESHAFAFSAGVADLAKLMRGVAGRKQVVLLSEGFAASSLMGTADKERTNELNQAAATGEYWKVDSNERYGSGTLLTAIDEMVEELRLADCVVQSIDVGGLRTAELAGEDEFRVGSIAGAGRDNSLFIMADKTGGELYLNFNDLGDALGRVLDRTSVTYLLAFQPQEVKADGKFHKLEVKLVGGPAGAEILHRPGYYAPRPWAELSAEERRLDAADKIVRGLEGGALEVWALAAPFHVAGGRPYVPLLLEIDGPTLVAERRAKRLGLEVYAYAFRLDGTIADFMTQNLSLDLGQVGPVISTTGAKLFAHFDLDAGDYQVRVLVREADSGRSSLRVLSLRVPDFSAAEPALSPALVAEPPGKWVMVRESPRPDRAREVAYPFMKAGQPFIPAAQPALPVTNAADLCFFAYHAGAHRARLEGEWLDEGGRQLGEARLEVLERAPEDGADMERIVARLEPPGFAAGRYRLLTRLVPADGGRALVSSTWFALAP